jgi:hypothetical protein
MELRATWRMAESAASHRPSAQSPRTPASSYARSAASRQAARTVSTRSDGVLDRCDIGYPVACRECERHANQTHAAGDRVAPFSLNVHLSS